jgi:hypothetical protein
LNPLGVIGEPRWWLGTVISLLLIVIAATAVEIVIGTTLSLTQWIIIAAVVVLPFSFWWDR